MLKKTDILHFVEREKDKKTRKLEVWNAETSQAKVNEWFDFNQKRHDFINYFNEFGKQPKDYRKAIMNANELVQKKTAIPELDFTELQNSRVADNIAYSANLFQDSGLEAQTAFRNASEAVRYAGNLARLNSTISYNGEIVKGLNGAIRGLFVNPYEAHVLFETTSIGYQGVTIPIKEGFSTPISVASDLLDGNDIKGIAKYIANMDVLSTIKTAIIDSQVFGGGIITPMFEENGTPYYLGDLTSMRAYFGRKNFKLKSLICFDRYCTLPIFSNDGIFTLRMRSTLPVALRTIFEDSVLEPEWYSGFNTLTTSLSKLIRPDNFGLSIFARAGKAVYSFEQQLQFLNYALGQLSIIVFNSKSKPYEEGGSADMTWDNPFGGSQVQDIKSQLASMQQSANVQRGLYLNDIEVSALNRTFTGIGDIIAATDKQVSNAFGIKQDLLFGNVKSGLGNQTDEMATPMQTKYREMYRNPIIKVLRWCVLGYFAERDFVHTKNGELVKWEADEFFRMLESLDVVYEDSIKTNESILKEYGVSEILKLVSGRLMKTSTAISYIQDIPIINKISETIDNDEKKYKQMLDTLQEVGIRATIAEQEAIEKINIAIRDKQDPLAPTLENANHLSEAKGVYDINSPRNKPLADFGNLDKDGVVRPISPNDRQTAQEPVGKEGKITSHEKGL